MNPVQLGTRTLRTIGHRLLALVTVSLPWVCVGTVFDRLWELVVPMVVGAAAGQPVAKKFADMRFQYDLPTATDILLFFTQGITATLFYGAAVAAVVLSTAAVLRGKDASVSNTWRGVWRRLGAVWVSSFVLWAGFILTLAMCVLPGIVFLGTFGFLLPVLLVDGASPRVAFRRSQELANGHRVALGATVFLMVAAVMLIALVSGPPRYTVTSPEGATHEPLRWLTDAWIYVRNLAITDAVLILVGVFFTLAFSEKTMPGQAVVETPPAQVG